MVHRLGIDVGAAQVKVALCHADGALVAHVCHPTQGRPLEAALAALAALAAPDDLRLRAAVTGVAAPLLAGAGLADVNEVVAAAAGARAACPGLGAVVDMGGQFAKWIALGDDGAVVDFATNGLCAAGSGAFLEQQASRLEVSADELGRMADGAPRGATIAGRCSVFAKSDMIHLQQKGTPADEIAYGLCQALVRTFLSTVVAARAVPLPLGLVGGGAANPGIVRAFRELLGLAPEALVVPPEPLTVGAVGAALLADAAPVTTLGALRAALDGHARAAAAAPAALAELPPLPSPPGGERLVEEPPLPPGDGPIEAWLGVDVGSVSTNLVLLRADPAGTGELLHGVYLPTRGRPAEVLREGMERIRRRFGERLRVVGVGTTGSGRHLAAELLGADAVHNEITAQTVSAAYYAPDVDTIFEVGGQDAKYVSVRDGHLADFEMNRICSAGTGSFLEEQARRLGVEIIGEFARRALAAGGAPDLGTRCTVFMDAELVRAQQRGASLDALCAGLAYGVARNYLEKVVAGRPVGRRILFQGGTASNEAVVAAFGALLGRPLAVHPYNRLSGAIGAALLAERAARMQPVGAGAAASGTRFRGVAAIADATPEVRSFECRHCDNRCQVNRIAIGARVVHFGDTCERYAARDRALPDGGARERPFPELFAAREALLERHLAALRRGAPGRPRLGLLRGTLNAEYLVLWATLLTELGYEPALSPRTSPRLLREHGGGVPAEVCLPIKAAAAQARALLAEGGCERVFVPGLLECGPDAADDAVACLYAQQLPDMLRGEHGGRVVTAKFGLDDGALARREQGQRLSRALRRPPEAVDAALEAAYSAYRRFRDGRRALGAEALAAPFDRAVVVLGKPYNTHDAAQNLALARHLERAGLPAIPWDLLPLDEVALDGRWDVVPWQGNRDQLRAAAWIARDPRLFPVLVSSYGCGPDGFTVKHLEELLAHRPRLLLEFDEHQGEAGLVTRVEAFADEIEVHLRAAARGQAAERPRAATPGPPAVASFARSRDGVIRFVLPDYAEAVGVYAAVLRAAGHETVLLPPPDAASARLGEEVASGRECHPYAMLAGDLVRWLRAGDRRPGDVFLSLGCETTCLLRQYGDGLRLVAERLGAPDATIWTPTTAELGEVVGTALLVRLYEGLVATDALVTLGVRLRAYERRAGAVDAVLARALGEVNEALARHRRLGPVLAAAEAELWAVPRAGAPGDRPVVGVTGDLYTRLNALANGDLFRRLEALGCEVWPSPALASLGDLSSAAIAPRLVRTGRVRGALFEGLSWALMAGTRRLLLPYLSPTARELAVEPPPDDLLRRAAPYLDRESNYLVQQLVAKVADFLARGADGVISAAGIHCMVGVSAAAAVPRLRADHGGAPVLPVVYGANEGPAQRLRLETFVHQVKERAAATPRAARSLGSAAS
jgi:predicted CoA-substrate-specific enzyme activase